MAAIADVLSISRRMGVDVWLRGGWAMDFYLGEVGREHLDVGFFAWRHNLPRLVMHLAAAR